MQLDNGAAMLFFVMFFMAASFPLVLLMSNTIYADLIAYRTLNESKLSYQIAEAAIEDSAYRRLTGTPVDVTETLSIFGGSATTDTVVNSGGGLVTIESEGSYNSTIRRSEIVLNISSGASFNFGVQSGNGGFSMNNTAKVYGNVFSNGSVIGGGSSEVLGDVTSAGPSGVVDGVTASSVRANSIGPSRSTLIKEDAFCQTIDLGNTTVWGSTDNCPSWPDEATTTLPFPDSKVNAWKATITAAILSGEGKLIASTDPECAGGTYVIDSDYTFASSTKIECNLTIDKNGTTLTIQDHIWVEGNLLFKSGPTIESNPVVATSSVLMIADNESNRITSSMIEVQNGTDFSAPSSPKSYIMLVSMNDSAENGGTETAINMGQSSNGDVIIYAGHGKVSLTNQISLKEVTGYLIDMGNNSEIIYESGLIDLNFVGGPGGGFEISSWSEVE